MWKLRMTPGGDITDYHVSNLSQDYQAHKKKRCIRPRPDTMFCVCVMLCLVATPHSVLGITPMPPAHSMASVKAASMTGVGLSVVTTESVGIQSRTVMGAKIGSGTGTKTKTAIGTSKINYWVLVFMSLGLLHMSLWVFWLQLDVARRNSDPVFLETYVWEDAIRNATQARAQDRDEAAAAMRAAIATPNQDGGEPNVGGGFRGGPESQEYSATGYTVGRDNTTTNKAEGMWTSMLQTASTMAVGGDNCDIDIDPIIVRLDWQEFYVEVVYYVMEKYIRRMREEEEKQQPRVAAASDPLAGRPTGHADSTPAEALQQLHAAIRHWGVDKDGKQTTASQRARQGRRSDHGWSTEEKHRQPTQAEMMRLGVSKDHDKAGGVGLFASSQDESGNKKYREKALGSIVVMLEEALSTGATEAADLSLQTTATEQLGVKTHTSVGETTEMHMGTATGQAFCRWLTMIFLWIANILMWYGQIICYRKDDKVQSSLLEVAETMFANPSALDAAPISEAATTSASAGLSVDLNMLAEAEARAGIVVPQRPSTPEMERPTHADVGWAERVACPRKQDCDFSDTAESLDAFKDRLVQLEDRAANMGISAMHHHLPIPGGGSSRPAAPSQNLRPEHYWTPANTISALRRIRSLPIHAFRADITADGASGVGSQVDSLHHILAHGSRPAAAGGGAGLGTGNDCNAWFRKAVYLHVVQGWMHWWSTYYTIIYWHKTNTDNVN